ncbi:MAG: hypothetical protein JSV88_26065 [Candidatus Aminicenantes bacterium]|nr:MAG: hypothetical protein JSV88_26065 [Candidatus Aminicenantes bacterium]
MVNIQKKPIEKIANTETKLTEKIDNMETRLIETLENSKVEIIKWMFILSLAHAITIIGGTVIILKLAKVF